MHRNLLLCLILLLAAVSCSKPAFGLGNRGPLQIDIHADRDCVKAGEVVKLRAVVTNRGETTQVISLEDKPVLDMRIAYSKQSEYLSPDTILHWSDGRELTAEDKRLELAPDESKTIAIDWVAEEARGLSSQIELFGLLRYGEGDSDVAVARTFISVDMCTGYRN